MNSIYLINPEQLDKKVDKTVDIFSGYAEALSVPIKNRREESVIAVANVIMKNLSRTQKDFGGILKRLEFVVLELVENIRTNPKEIKHSHFDDKSIKITRRQKEALASSKTFDSRRIKEMSIQVNDLVRKVARHRSLVQELSNLQQQHKTIEKQLEGTKEEIFISIGDLPAPGSLENITASEFKHVLLVMKTLKEKYNTLRTEMKNIEDQYDATVKEEFQIRKAIEKVGLDVYKISTKLISRKLLFGIRCLQNIVTEMATTDNGQAALGKIGEIDVDSLVERLVIGCAVKYVFPSKMPDKLSTNTYNSASMSDLGKLLMEGTIPTMDNTIRNSYVLTPKYLSQTTNGADQNGHYGLENRKPENWVKQTFKDSKHIDRLPGFIHMKKGMKIRKTSLEPLHQIAFGYVHRGPFRHKCWGFFCLPES